MALGSVIELEVQLDLAVALAMVAEGHPVVDRCNKVKRSIIRLIKSVRSLNAER